MTGAFVLGDPEHAGHDLEPHGRSPTDTRPAGPDRWIGVRDPVRRRALAGGVPPPPLPLSDEEALERALWLHSRGLLSPAIAVVMGVYHGVWCTPSGWNTRLKVAGAKGRWPARPHLRRNRDAR